MATLNTFTIVGGLTADPEVRFNTNGKAMATFTIASSERSYDRERSEWVEKSTLYMRCVLWGKAAENVAETLRKGDRVIATGTLVASSYTDRDGNKRTSTEMRVEEIGPSLLFKTYKATETGTPRQYDAPPASVDYADEYNPQPPF